MPSCVMRKTNLKVKLKNKTFILAGLKLFLNTENCCSLLLYICQDGSCCLCGSLDKFKNCFIADDRILTTYNRSHDSLLILILFLGLCNVWLWGIGNILKNIKMEAVYPIEMLTAQPTVKQCKIPKTGSLLSRCLALTLFL